MVCVWVGGPGCGCAGRELGGPGCGCTGREPVHGEPGPLPCGPPRVGCRTPGWRSAVQRGSMRKGGRPALRTRPQTSRRVGGGYAGNGVSLGAGEAWLGRLEPPHPPLLSPSRPEGPAHHVAPTLPPNTGPQRAGCSRLGPGLRRPPWDEGGGPGVLAPGQTLSRVEVCIRPVTCPHTGRRRATAER